MNPNIYTYLEELKNRPMTKDDLFYLMQEPSRGVRERLPERRTGETYKMRVMKMRFPLYVRTGEYPDGRLGEIFINMGREGDQTEDMLGAVAFMASLAMQYGCPIEVIHKGIKNFTGFPKAIADVLENFIKESKEKAA